MAIKYHIYVDQGADYSVTIDVAADDGTPFDLTDYTVAAQMRKNFAASAAITFVSSLGAEPGQIILSLPKEMTTEIDPGRYLYDAEITDTNTGITTRVVEGVVFVNAGMTRI